MQKVEKNIDIAGKFNNLQMNIFSLLNICSL